MGTRPRSNRSQTFSHSRIPCVIDGQKFLATGGTTGLDELAARPEVANFFAGDSNSRGAAGTGRSVRAPRRRLSSAVHVPEGRVQLPPDGPLGRPERLRARRRAGRRPVACSGSVPPTTTHALAAPASGSGRPRVPMTHPRERLPVTKTSSASKSNRNRLWIFAGSGLPRAGTRGRGAVAANPVPLPPHRPVSGQGRAWQSEPETPNTLRVSKDFRVVEIGEFDRPVRGDQQVSGLHVAVDHPSGVGGREPAARPGRPPPS